MHQLKAALCLAGIVLFLSSCASDNYCPPAYNKVSREQVNDDLPSILLDTFYDEVRILSSLLADNGDIESAGLKRLKQSLGRSLILMQAAGIVEKQMSPNSLEAMCILDMSWSDWNMDAAMPKVSVAGWTKYIRSFRGVYLARLSKYGGLSDWSQAERERLRDCGKLSQQSD